MFDFEEANKILINGISEKTDTYLDAKENFPDRAVSEIIRKYETRTILEKDEDCEITNIDTAMKALTRALMARKMQKNLTEAKREFFKDHVEFQKSVNKGVEKYIEQLNQIENSLKSRIEIWIDDNMNEAFPDGLDCIKVSDGSISRCSSWDYEVKDLDLIPMEFFTVHGSMIEEAIKNGVREIPGLHIFERSTMKLRVKNQ